MARYFKYKSVDEIRAESHRLGLDLRFHDDFSPLFRQVEVGGRVVGNSWCVQPMEGCDGRIDGVPDELTFRRYRRFGAGGAKLIWGEAAAVVEEGRANSRQLWIREEWLSEFGRLADECRAAHRESVGDDSDMLIGLQLTHSGRYSYRLPLRACEDPMLDPRLRTADSPLLTDDDLERLIDRFVEAAMLVRRAGFDFVDVKQCHRYLLNELLAGRTRPGRFGGDFEGRTRFARTVISRIRNEVPGLIVGSRLNVFDGVPFQANAATKIGEPSDIKSGPPTVWGTHVADLQQADLTEPIRWIREMHEMEVALINVSMGNPYASPHLLRPFEYPPPDGYESPEHPLIGVDRHFRLTAEVQRACPGLPVVGSGYSYLQEFLPHAGAANIRDGRTTFVGVGRATLSQPDFVNQIREHGRLDRKRICRTFSYCTALMRSKQNEMGQFAAGCPPFDKDVYGPIWQEALRTRTRE